MEHLDSTDKKILSLLQLDATLSATEVAEHIGLSQSPCWRRINRLQQEGYIQSIQAVVSRKKIGLEVAVLLNIKLSAHGRKMQEEFEEIITAFPQVLECWSMSGDMDYSLRVVAKSIDDYEGFLRRNLLALPHINEIQSHFAMREVKNITHLPIED